MQTRIAIPPRAPVLYLSLPIHASKLQRDGHDNREVDIVRLSELSC